MNTSSDMMDAISSTQNRFTFKRKISFKNGSSLRLILDKAEYLQDKDEEDAKLLA